MTVTTAERGRLTSVPVSTRGSHLPETVDEETGSHSAPFPAPPGKRVRLSPLRAAPEQYLLAVEFRSPDGRSWNAIGGGPTVAEAITQACESCPDDANWDAVGWNHLYGD